jgi:hypothetical protein
MREVRMAQQDGSLVGVPRAFIAASAQDLAASGVVVEPHTTTPSSHRHDDRTFRGALPDDAAGSGLVMTCSTPSTPSTPATVPLCDLLDLDPRGSYHLPIEQIDGGFTFRSPAGKLPIPFAAVTSEGCAPSASWPMWMPPSRRRPTHPSSRRPPLLFLDDPGVESGAGS